MAGRVKRYFRRSLRPPTHVRRAERMPGEVCVYVCIYLPSPLFVLLGEPEKHAGSLELNSPLGDESHRGGTHVEPNRAKYHRADGAMASPARDRRESATSVPPLASARSQHAQMTRSVRACTTGSTKRPPVSISVTAYRLGLTSCHTS